MSQRRVDVSTPDGVLDCYLFEPAGAVARPVPGIVLYMDAFAIRPALASMAERLASEGFVVALPNLYYRSGTFPPFDPHLVAAGGAERERFSSMIKSIDGAMVMRDTDAVIALLDRTPGVRPGPLGAVGYCMGGGYALSAAGTFPDRISVAASFHGGSLATASPHSPHLLAARMRARLYIGVAEHDHEVGRREAACVDRCGDLHHALAAVGVAQHEAVRIDRIDMRARAGDQRHVRAGRRERAADGAAERAGAEHMDLHHGRNDRGRGPCRQREAGNTRHCGSQ